MDTAATVRDEGVRKTKVTIGLIIAYRWILQGWVGDQQADP